MSKGKKVVGIVATLLLLVGVLCWAFGGEDAQVKKVRQMRDAMFVEGKPPQREKFEAFRKEFDQLTPEQRRQLDGDRRQEMERRREKEMDAYFAMSTEQRAAFLDKRIAEMEKRRATGGPPPGAPPGGGPPPGSPGPGGPPPGGPGGPGGPGRETPAQRRQHRVDMLTHSSPQDRARRAAFMADEIKRRVALGLSPMPAPPPRPPTPNSTDHKAG